MIGPRLLMHQSIRFNFFIKQKSVFIAFSIFIAFSCFLFFVVWELGSKTLEFLFKVGNMFIELFL